MLRKYKITVIFDTREQEESPDEMRRRLGTLMATLGAKVEEDKSLGIRDFSRCASRKFQSGAYAQYLVSAPSSFNGEFSKRLRLDKTIDRALTERL
ncbi:MAG: 30S ribosomal protein S6 [Puniceicoccales bacterium]|nr:30S ribosomal protein S6 [Puniceicoccales bacterium]